MIQPTLYQGEIDRGDHKVRRSIVGRTKIAGIEHLIVYQQSIFGIHWQCVIEGEPLVDFHWCGSINGAKKKTRCYTKDRWSCGCEVCQNKL